jgi:phosphoglycolate phosphatase
VEHFRQARETYGINPARAYACGDEKKDYLAALATGMHPFMVAYGFEDFDRLTGKIGVPAELIARDPEELCARVVHALDLSQGRAAPMRAPRSHPLAGRAPAVAWAESAPAPGGGGGPGSPP